MQISAYLLGIEEENLESVYLCNYLCDGFMNIFWKLFQIWTTWIILSQPLFILLFYWLSGIYFDQLFPQKTQLAVGAISDKIRQEIPVDFLNKNEVEVQRCVVSILGLFELLVVWAIKSNKVFMVLMGKIVIYFGQVLYLHKLILDFSHPDFLLFAFGKDLEQSYVSLDLVEAD